MPTLGTTLRTLQKTLEESGLNPAPSEARELVAHATGLEANRLIFHENNSLSEEKTAHLQKLLAERLTGKPLAYVLGYTWFAGRKWNVTADTLIPRPDTETLIEAITNTFNPTQSFTGVEVGVGSGAILGTLALHFPGAIWHGTDISPEAVQTAQSNLNTYHITNTTLHTTNLLEGLAGPFNLVLSNPPYISETDYQTLEPSVIHYEPKLALTAPNNGLAFYEKLTQQAPSLLTPGGWLMVEIGHTQEKLVTQLFQNAGFQNIQTQKDLASRPRVIIGQKKA